LLTRLVLHFPLQLLITLPSTGIYLPILQSCLHRALGLAPMLAIRKPTCFRECCYFREYLIERFFACPTMQLSHSGIVDQRATSG
jgi:hypothetical protein